MSEPRLCEGITYRLPYRFDVDLSGIGLEINFFDLVVSTTPGIRLVRNGRVQDFGNTIEAQRRPLVKIITIIVVPAVEDCRYHRSFPIQKNKLWHIRM